METDTPEVQETPTGSKKLFWAGWVVTAIPLALLTMSSVMKLIKAEPVVEELGRLGYEATVIPGIGIVELISVVLYAVPRTAMLGAILLTGYLGGAITSHVRVDDPFIGPAVFGVLVWLGLFLRDQRLRALIPLR